MADNDAPYLDDLPPAWAARALASVLLALFAVGVVVLVTVRVPETVSAPFTVVATSGSDPVRPLHGGVITQVVVAEGQQVKAGDPLFTIGSEQVGDRTAERETLGTSLSGGDARIANERLKFENQRRADEQELARLDQRQRALRTQLGMKSEQIRLQREVLARQQKSFEEGLTSWIEVSKPAIEVERMNVDIEATRAEIAEAASADARLRFEMASRRAAFEELTRSVGEELTRARVRKGLLDREGVRDGNALTVAAECGGTVVRLRVQHAGTVVSPSEVLADILCDTDTLEAELLVPQRGLAQVAPGQDVKLRYDAFPYQRFGVRYGTVRWVSPTAEGAGDAAAFRVRTTLDEQELRIGDRLRAVRPGMAGQASVIVGRRTLASYALAPLRQVREAMSAGRPPAATAR